MIGGTTVLVGLLRDPKVGSLSPRMQNAAFAALALDVAYVPLGVAPEQLEDAVRGMVALGFLGANVTTPHKQAVGRSATSSTGGVDSVNTLVIRDGRVLGSSTDTAALGDRRPATAAVVGAGGAATAWIAELEARGAVVAHVLAPRRLAAADGATPSSSSTRRRSRTSSSSSRGRVRP